MENLTNMGFVKKLLEEHNFSFSKGLGQNFLINPSVCPKIAELGNAAPGTGIIEIGTGIGTLTSELASRADKVVAVEIDTRLLPILEVTLKDYKNIKVINQDIMKTDIKALIRDEFDGLDVAVCANLPYYLTSPIIMMLLESRADIKSVTVMVQKEAADRLCAKVGTRESGAITVGVNYYGTAQKLFNVSRGSFVPAPNVDSSVIRIDIDKTKYKLDEKTEKFFFSIVKGAFSQRRKTLANSLSSSMSLNKQDIYDALKTCGLNANTRIEELDMEKLMSLAQTLNKNNY